MARSCFMCGKELEEGVAFCTECGTRVPDDAQNNGAEPQMADTTAAPVSPIPQTVYVPCEPDPKTKVVGTGSFFGLMLLFSLPVIGLIASIIMSFAPKNKNLKHYARAALIWQIIGLVVLGLLCMAVNAMIQAVVPYIEEMIGDITNELNNYGDVIGDLGQYGDQIGEIGGQIGDQIGGVDGFGQIIDELPILPVG